LQYSVRQFINWTAEALGMQLRWEGEGVKEVAYWTNCPMSSLQGAEGDPAIQDAISASETSRSREGEARGGRQSLPLCRTDKPIVRIDPRYFRPTEVETLLGDPSKAKAKLGWVPEITVQQMCKEMVASDLAQAKQHALLKSNGYQVSVSVE
jgi:GDPmannose 4,6-dehydratase